VLGFYCAAGLRRARGASGGGLAAQRARTLRRSGLRRTPSPCSDRRSAPSVHFLPDASGARCLRAEELRSRVRGACCSQRAWAARSRPERARGGGALQARAFHDADLQRQRAQTEALERKATGQPPPLPRRAPAEAAGRA
jgi:hypothetical protein